MTAISKLCARFLKDTSGATAIEYGLLASIICTALITCFSLFSNSLQGVVDYVSTTLSNAMK